MFKTAVVATIVALSMVSTSAVADTDEYEFTGIGQPGSAARITFSSASTGTLSFLPESGATFSIVSSTDGSLNPSPAFIGTISGSFNLSFPAAISGMWGSATGSSTGSGTLVIDDPNSGDDLTATISFSDIVLIQTGSIGSILASSPALTNVSYSGSNPGLSRIAIADDSSFGIQVAFRRTDSLLTLNAGPGVVRTGGIQTVGYYSAAPIPEPSTYAMLAVGIGMVAFSIGRARSRA